jgi:hypothetical protein
LAEVKTKLLKSDTDTLMEYVPGVVGFEHAKGSALEEAHPGGSPFQT